MVFTGSSVRPGLSIVKPTRRSAICRSGVDFCKDKVAERREVDSAGKSFTVEFKGSNEQMRQISCADNEYILDAAERQNVELPCTCRGGICGACVGRLVSGKVDSSDIPDLTFTLEEHEIEQGMRLLCMSRPESDLVIETQSDWGYSLGIKEWETNGKYEGEVNPLMGKKWSEINKEKE